MASCKLFGYADAGKMLDHTNRRHEQTRDGHIDTGRTYVNRRLSPLRDLEDEEYLMKRVDEVRHVNRRTLRIMASWVVTVPKDFLGEHTERVNEFFDSVYDFLTGKYGEINTVSAWVHYDEETPHMHFNFVPAVKDEKHGERICASECIPYGSYGAFHYELKDHLDRRFGFSVNVVNGAVKEGNLTVLQLKLRTADRELEKLENEIAKAREALRRSETLSGMRVEKTDNGYSMDENTFTALLRSAQAYELYRDVIEDISAEKKAAERLVSDSVKDVSVSYALFRENIRTVLSDNVSMMEELRKKLRELSDREEALSFREEILKLRENAGEDLGTALSEENRLLKERLQKTEEELTRLKRSFDGELKNERETVTSVFEKEFRELSDALSRADRLNGLYRLRDTYKRELEEITEDIGGSDASGRRRILEAALSSVNRELEEKKTEHEALKQVRSQ